MNFTCDSYENLTQVLQDNDYSFAKYDTWSNKGNQVIVVMQ